ncbi:hypothetical protein Fmac_020764 [Flemingia macrophylla]|uniref:Uncharacterized protein n=1 Tax=Flemingia macrophylla TaxID=520843 RepID=A0ABD1LUY9_9FABA
MYLFPRLGFRVTFSYLFLIIYILLLFLFLQDNTFSGKIPTVTTKFVDFDVSNNRLNNFIPQTLSKFLQSSFVGNLDLCGPQLEPCNPFFPAPTPSPSSNSTPMPPHKKSNKLSIGAIVVIVFPNNQSQKWNTHFISLCGAFHFPSPCSFLLFLCIYSSSLRRFSFSFTLHNPQSPHPLFHLHLPSPYAFILLFLALTTPPPSRRHSLMCFHRPPPGVFFPTPSLSTLKASPPPPPPLFPRVLFFFFLLLLSNLNPKALTSVGRGGDGHGAVLKSEISVRESEIDRNKRRAEEADVKNERLRKELQELKLQEEESKRKMKMLEDEVAELKKTASFSGGTGHEASKLAKPPNTATAMAHTALGEDITGGLVEAEMNKLVFFEEGIYGFNLKDLLRASAEVHGQFEFSSVNVVLNWEKE